MDYDFLIVLWFNDTSTLWVILCCLPEKGSKEIEEIEEEIKRGTGSKEEQE